MGIDLDITDNLNVGNIEGDNLLSSYDAHTDLINKMLDEEMYNQELYNGGVGNRYTGVKGVNGPKTDLFNIINEATDFDVSNVDYFKDNKIGNISKSYNKTADMYRNQRAVDNYTKEKKEKFKKRNYHLLQGVNNKMRKKEIYTYYYKKYDAQKKILSTIIIASLLVIVLVYLNKRFKFLLSDTLFVLALGIVFAFFAINISYQLIEIFFRNNINFDEYDFMFNSLDSNINTLQSNKEKDREKCDVEIKAYEGRQI